MGFDIVKLSRKSKGDPVAFTKGAGGRFNLSLHEDVASKFQSGVVDVMIGNGEDTGSLAICEGTTYKLRKVGRRATATCGRVLTAMGYGPDGGTPAATPHSEWRGDKLVIHPAVDAATVSEPVQKKQKNAA